MIYPTPLDIQKNLNRGLGVLALSFLCVLTCGGASTRSHIPATMAFFTRIDCTSKPGSYLGRERPHELWRGARLCLKLLVSLTQWHVHICNLSTRVSEVPSYPWLISESEASQITFDLISKRKKKNISSRC